MIRSSWITHSGTAVFLSLLAFFLGWREISSPDLGFHLNSARYILQNGHWPSAEPFLFTTPSATYVDLQWLFQLVTGWVFQFVGPSGLSICLILLIALILLLCRWRIKPLGIHSVGGFFVVGFLFLLSQDWEWRPGLFSAAYLALLLITLEKHKRSASRVIWFLPGLFLLWVNTHALFSIGLVVMAIYTVCAWIASVKQGEIAKINVQTKTITITFVLCLLACLVNPYGIYGLIFPLKQFMILGSTVYNDSSTGIAELRGLFDPSLYEGSLGQFSPQVNLLTRQLLFFLILIAYWITRKGRVLSDWLLLVAFGWIAWSAYRNFLFLLVLAAPVLVEAWSKTFEVKKAMRHLGVVTVAAVCCLTLVVIALVNLRLWYGWQGAPVKYGSGISRMVVPAFLQNIHPKGSAIRIMTGVISGGWTSYLMDARASIDGRIEVYPPDLYQTYQSSLAKPREFSRWLRDCHPDAVLVFHQFNGLWLEMLSRRPQEWLLIHQDEYFSLFAHEGVFPGCVPVQAPVPGKDFPFFTQDEAQQVRAQGATLPQCDLYGWLQGIDAFAPFRLRWSYIFSLRHEFEAAEGQALAGLRESPYFYPDLWINLADTYEAQGRLKEADDCWKVIMDRDPKPANRKLWENALSRRKH